MKPFATTTRLMFSLLMFSLLGAALVPAVCHADMQAALEPGPHSEHQLTSDGVHMNPLGDRMMARSILKSFGLSDAELKTANDAWLNAPHTCEVAGKAKLTLRQYEQLRQLAAQRGTSVGTLVQEETSKAIAAVLKTAP